jgi:hypothetical protein
MRSWIRLAVDLQVAQNSPDAQSAMQHKLAARGIDSGQRQPRITAFKKHFRLSWAYGGAGCWIMNYPLLEIDLTCYFDRIDLRQADDWPGASRHRRVER